VGLRTEPANTTALRRQSATDISTLVAGRRGRLAAFVMTPLLHFVHLNEKHDVYTYLFFSQHYSARKRDKNLHRSWHR